MLQKVKKSESRSKRVKPAKDKLEAAVKKAVKNVLTNFGAYQFWPVQTGMGKRTLDCIACVPVRITPDLVGKTIGCFVAIETKRESVSTPTSKQANTIREMRSAAAVAILINSVQDIEIEDKLIWAIKNGMLEGGNWVNLQSPYIRGQLGGN